MQIEVMQIQIEVHSRRRPGILYRCQDYQHPIIVLAYYQLLSALHNFNITKIQQYTG